MSLIKVIEVMSNSSKSWEDAAQSAVSIASKTLKNIRSVYVSDQSAIVEDDKIISYRLTLKLSFELDTHNGKKKK
jgi:flavin-binding protein dodecin